MLKKMYFSRTVTPNGTIFNIEHPQDKEIKMCSNKVPGVTNGHTLRGNIFI